MTIKNALPVLYATGSTICFVTMQIFVKILSQQISPQYIIFIRSLSLFLINSLFIYNSKEYRDYEKTIIKDSLAQKTIQAQEKNVLNNSFTFNIKKNSSLILMLKRQFWTAVSVNLFLSSLQYVHISIANALNNTSPIITFFIEALYYKKPINKIHLLLSVISFVGVFIIIDPLSKIKDQTFDWHILMPLASAFTYCLNWLYLHQMRNTFKQIIVLEYTYTFQILSSGFLISMSGSIESDSNYSSLPLTNAKMLICFICIIFFGYITNILRIKATFLCQPSQILVFNYIGIIYSLFLDSFLFKNKLQLSTIVGAFLTSIGLLSNLAFRMFGL